MPGEWGDARGERAKPDHRPPATTAEQRAQWRQLGRDKFQDREYQRYAQAHRTHESLRDAGRRGYQETARRYGRDFGARLLADYRQRHPSDAERAMMATLGALGQREGCEYWREYPVGPGGPYADFAWPERKLAIEVIGTAHSAAFFQEQGLVEREARRMAVYEREGWRVRTVTWQELRDRPDQTRERVQALLAPAEGRQGTLW